MEKKMISDNNRSNK